MDKKSLVVSSLTGYEDEIGRWLWCIEDVRRTLLTELIGIRQAFLDSKIGERPSISTRRMTKYEFICEVRYILCFWSVLV